MKKILAFIAFLYISAPSMGQSKEEVLIRNLETYWGDLLDKSDTTALRKVWSKDYIVNNPAGKIITGEDIIGFIRNGQRFPAYQRVIEKIVFSGNNAIVMGKEISQPKSDKDQPITRRFTNIWIKEKKSWKLLARQATNI